MLCQNCGKKEVTFHYTHIINGVKKEMALCDTCAKELGIEKMDLNMPIDFSSFLGNFFEDYEEGSFLPGWENTSNPTCPHCGISYEDFVDTGKFGCDHCYETFAMRLQSILKNLHGANQHVGRKALKGAKNTISKEEKEEKEEKKDEKQETIQSLQNKIKQLVKEEKYEEAAKIRDEIKKLEGKE